MDAANARPTAPLGLRIGIVHGGRLVEERVVDHRTEVSIGPTARCSFIVPDPLGPPDRRGRPRSRTLFRPAGDGWLLALDELEGIEGRVATEAETGPRRLEELRRGGREAGILLGAGARGRLGQGDLTVLFQVVALPARAPRPQLPPSLRRSLRQELDWILMAVVGLSLAAHGALVVGLRQVDLPRPSIAELPDRIAGTSRIRYLIPTQPEEPVETAVPVTPRPTAPSSGRPRRPVVVMTPAQDPRDPATMREAARLAAIRLIGAAGPEGSRGVIADLLARPDPGGDADRVFAEVGGTTVARPGEPLVLRGGATVGRRMDADLHRLAGPGAVDTGERGGERQARVRDHGRVSLGGGEVEAQAPGCRPERVMQAVRERMSGIMACYDRALGHGRVGGKLVLAFTVAPSGRVTNVEIDSDTVDDPELVACVTGRVAGWVMPDAGCGTARFSYPFVFVPPADAR